MNRVLLLLCSVLALASGWGIGRYLSPDPSGRIEPGVSSVAAETEKSPVAPALGEAGESEVLTKKVDELLKKLRASNDIGSLPEVFAFAKSLRSEEFAPAIARLNADKSLRPTFFMRPASLLAGYWMEVDSAAALDWFKQDSLKKLHSYDGILTAWAKMESDEYLDWVEQLPDAQKEMFGGFDIFQNERMEPGKFERNFAFLSKTSLGDSVTIDSLSITGHLFNSYAQSYPLEAAARVLALPGGSIRTQAAIGVVTAMVEKDPAAARQWAEEITDAALAAQVVSACASAMAQKDAKGAVEWVATLPDSTLNQKAMTTALGIWAEEDATAALEWVDGFPEGSNVDSYVARILSSMEATDTELALKTILERSKNDLPVGQINVSLEHGPYAEYARSKGASEALKIASSIPEKGPKGPRILNSLYSVFVMNAANENFPDTSKWLLEQKSSPRKIEALGKVAGSLLKRDRDEAVKWAQSLPENLDHDRAKETVANQVFQSDTETAVNLYREMADQKLAQTVLKRRTQQWIEVNRTAAEKWLNQSSAFSSAEKAELLKKEGAK